MWAAVVNMILGVWVMMAPAILGYETAAAHNSYVVGPLVITFAITAIWEVNRSARFLNIPAGLWLAVAPFVLGYEGVSVYNDLATGLAIAALSLAKGKITGSYGGGWRSLFQKKPLHEQDINVSLRH
jgi:hypothetical protein